MLQYSTVDPKTLDLLRSLIHSETEYPKFRLFSIEGIMAMKIAAILKRGVKKDFWDISEWLLHFTIDEMIEAYDTKFRNNQLLISIP